MLNKNLCVVQIVLIMFIRPTETVVAMRTVDKSCEVCIVWVILHYKLLFVVKPLNITKSSWPNSIKINLRHFYMNFSTFLLVITEDVDRRFSKWLTNSYILLTTAPSSLPTNSNTLEKSFFDKKTDTAK